MNLDYDEKNKSVHKLNGIGSIYCINLDEQPERWEFMQKQFKYWNIEDKVTRISAYDGREDDLSDIIAGKYPDTMSSGEIGCVTSHLKAIKMFLDTDDPYAIMMEDDCSLDLVQTWNFTWKDFFSHIPFDWDVVQIAIICTGDIHVKLHKRFVNDFSTACYLITRHHAEKLVRLHCRGGYTGKQKYKLDNGCKPRAVADDLIYNAGNTYAIPMLVYNYQLGSSIHPEHVDAFHKGNYEAQTNFWVQNSSQIDIKDYMNYDPYVGRTSENSSLPKDDQTWSPGHWDAAPEPDEGDMLEGEENQFTPGLPA
tara:strand:+ start:682 stop:1608 length:927 start_codon:yes stop_codon:yes gene_type:complete